MKSGRFVWYMFAGAILGMLVGAFLPNISVKFRFIGTMFLNALKLVVLPLIAVSISNAFFGFGNLKSIGKLGGYSFAYYLLTTSVAVGVGMLVAFLISPGKGSEIFTAQVIVKPKEFNLEEFVVNLVPPNIFKALVDFNVLGVIFAVILFSMAGVSSKNERIVPLLKELEEILLKMTKWIISLAPVGVFALISSKVGESGGARAIVPLFNSLTEYIFCVLLALLVHFFILSALCFFLGKTNPFRILKTVKDALLTAFATASSSATLPITMERTSRTGVSQNVLNFVLPVGATVNMDGTALYEAIAGIFIANAYGIELGTLQYVAIFLTAILAAVGAAGIPEAGLVTMVLVLQSAGLPVSGIGIILAVDWFLDRCRTTVNVWGDIVGCTVVHRMLESLTSKIPPARL